MIEGRKGKRKKKGSKIVQSIMSSIKRSDNSVSPSLSLSPSAPPRSLSPPSLSLSPSAPFSDIPSYINQTSLIEKGERGGRDLEGDEKRDRAGSEGLMSKSISLPSLSEDFIVTPPKRDSVGMNSSHIQMHEQKHSHIHTYNYSHI